MLKKLTVFYFLFISFLNAADCTLSNKYYKVLDNNTGDFVDAYRYKDSTIVKNGSEDIYLKCDNNYEGYKQYRCDNGKLDIIYEFCTTNCKIPSKGKYYAAIFYYGEGDDEFYVNVNVDKKLKSGDKINSDPRTGFAFEECDGGFKKYKCVNGKFDLVSQTCEGSGACKLDGEYYKSTVMKNVNPIFKYNKSENVENGNIKIYKPCNEELEDYKSYKCVDGKLILIEDKCDDLME